MFSRRHDEYSGLMELIVVNLGYNLGVIPNRFSLFSNHGAGHHLRHRTGAQPSDSRTEMQPVSTFRIQAHRTPAQSTVLVTRVDFYEDRSQEKH